ncbi:MAG: DUF4097 family beta strand repeat-containing protein [Kofleriaceae bacterium]
MKILIPGIVALLCAPALANPATEKSKVEVRPSAAPFKQLAIENPLGDVKVIGYDGSAVQIETVKHAPDDDTLDRLRVALVPENDGTVRIATSVDPAKELKPVGGGAVRIDIVIHAPRSARIDAATAAGKLEIENLDAGAELDSTSGQITVTNVSGELMTHSISGAMSLSQVFGAVDAATISSNVDLDSITGDKLVASAHKGSIAGRRVRSRDIELTTTDGRISLESEVALHGHWVVSSLRGDISIQLRRANNAVRIRARGGKVDLGQPANLIERTAGWTVATLGRPSDPSASVELQSKYGIVSLAVIQ